jgi:hypothetical protein
LKFAPNKPFKRSFFYGLGAGGGLVGLVVGPSEPPLGFIKGLLLLEVEVGVGVDVDVGKSNPKSLFLAGGGGWGLLPVKN